ncbi:M56 family metallopeptidase [Hwangdonia lutea]|uniref:M56 family metallopeptidase n=1 Tax=Hwangdonia lutea TaxID=3075823 RepID=A0AA97EN54_9FLAO|nr:M56 family metallopeptidase [Hwangdonia sp. SCSIO 19198]WOD44604.1 M56 family metallopeptidase [Hwangdonia sp. SCSIO 19198]
MFLLILKSSACLAVFILFYKLFLEKESVHHFKRFYLLGALLVSMVIPFITFTEYIQVEPGQEFMPFQPLAFTYAVVEKNTTWQEYIPYILWSIYALGVIIFSIRFLKNLFQLFQKIKTNPKFKNQNFINVLLVDLIHPHTFFNYIFLNKNKYEHNRIPNEVLWHEQTHAKQKHALDILFLEILHIIFWFNPLLYFIKKDIKLNHEFLADQAVLKQGVDTKNYQQLLLACSSPDDYRDARTNQLANAINYSLIKKRFTVMKTQTSKKVFWLKGLLILPILAMLIYGFSEKEIVEKEMASFKYSTTQETEKGATTAMMNEYKAFIEEVEKTNTIWAPKLNRAIAIYDLMTEAQRATVKKYPESPLANLATIKPKTPTETLFNSWKNKTEFAIWIDSKHVPNETLNNYKASDFKYYTRSFVYNNARSEKFPQPYQNHLYTKKGFEASYLKRNVNNYKSLKNDYLKAKKEFINSGKKDDSELRILKVRLDKLYNLLSKENIEKYNVKLISSTNKLELQQKRDKHVLILINKKGQLLVNDNLCKIKNLKNHLKKLSTEESEISSVDIKTDTDAPKEIINKVIKTLRELGILKVNLNKDTYEKPTQQKATPKEVAEYNKLAKHMSKQIKNKGSIKLKQVKRLKHLYSLMSNNQKEQAEPFPDLSLVPPPPPPAPKPAKAELVEVPAKSPKAPKAPKPPKTDKTKEVVPPPPPPVIKPSGENNSNHSEELQKAWKAFKTEGDTYGEAVQNYSTNKKGTLSALNKKYKEVMKLYKAYHDIAKNENQNAVPPPPPPMDPFSTYSSLAQRTKYIPVNRENNLQRLRVLYDKISDSKKNKVESPDSIGNYIKQLNSLTAEQTKKVTKLLNNINKKAKSEGRKFYSTEEYKMLEDLYASMISN